MTTFVDTSALYALIDRDDRFHVEAATIWRRSLENGALLATSNYVIVESSALVQSRLGIAALRTLTLDVLPNVESIWVGPEEHGAAVAACLTAGRRGLSLVDCTSFEIMRRSGLRQVFAFDPDFDAAGFTAVSA